MSPAISIRNCKCVPPPARFWRVTRWHEPFDPPPPPSPVGDHDELVDRAGRWDDPDGAFRTLYCASLPEGAIGEKLGDFALNPAAVVRIEAFLEEEPDEEFVDDQLLRPLDAHDIIALNWTLASAGAAPEVPFLDVNHWRTHVATSASAVELLVRFGLRALDRRAILDERRNFTRRLAGLWRAAASATADEPKIRGLRYQSRVAAGMGLLGALGTVPARLVQCHSRAGDHRPPSASFGRPEARCPARRLTPPVPGRPHYYDRTKMIHSEIRQFLLTMNVRDGVAEVRDLGIDYAAAMAAYEAAEAEHRGDSNYDIVLVGSDSLETVKRTHASSFAPSESDLVVHPASSLSQGLR